MKPYEEFEQLVAQLFRDAGASSVATNATLGGNQIDVVATFDEVAGEAIYAIECKQWSRKRPGIAEIHSFQKIIKSLKDSGLVTRGVIVSATGFTENARQATEIPPKDIALLQPEDIRMFGHAKATEDYRKSTQFYLTSRTPGFVHSAATNLTNNTRIADLHEYLTRYVQQDHPFALFLLGGIGCGKSTHLEQLCLHLARDAQNSPPLIPVLIRLDGYLGYSSITLDRYVSLELSKFGSCSKLTWESLSPDLEKQRVVFLFDGLDEIRQIVSISQLQRQLYHFVNRIGPHGKCVISCRSSILGIATELPTIIDSVWRDHLPQQKTTVLMLEMFDCPKIQGYLRQVLSEHDLPRALKLCQGDLFKRPIILRMLADVGYFQRGRHPLDTEEALLDYALNQLIKYRPELRTSHGDLWSDDDWRRVLEECALEMWIRQSVSLDQDGLQQVLTNELKAEPKVCAMDALSWDLRVRTVFEFTEDGLRFGHMLFRDFLAAHALARRICCYDTSSVRCDNRACDEDMIRYIRYACKRLRQGAIEMQRRLTPGRQPKGPPGWRWIWIPAGLGLVGQHECPSILTGRLRLFEKGFWISQRVVPRDLDNLQRLAKVEDDSQEGHLFLDDAPYAVEGEPLVRVNHAAAQRIAGQQFGGRLPTEEEWERAVGWVDGSFLAHSSAHSYQPCPPPSGATPTNPWGLQDCLGHIWQWTSTLDPASGIAICKGSWWGAPEAEKRSPWARLVPTEPTHVRTGLRVVVDGQFT